MKKTGIWAVVVLGVVLSSGALADDDETTGSIRCLLVSEQLVSSDNPLVSKSGLMSSFYWLGRLDGHAPNMDLEKSLMNEIAHMTQTDFKAEAVRCGGVLQTRGQAMIDIGADMQKKGAKMLEKENSH